MNNVETKLQRKLYIKLYDRMIKDLVGEIKSKAIILDPNFQRNYIWDNKKASLLIESILLNIPIPALYASENSNSNWDIVDGVQRLSALERYFDDKFKLSGLETLDDLNGKKYSQLSPDVQNKIERGELRLIVLQNDSDENIKFDIFMRLNSGSVQLNEQELRNCLYRGSLNDCIKNIVKNFEIIKKVFPFKTDRMVANELIFRYLSVSENFDKNILKITNYDGRIKNLINNFMATYRDANAVLLNDLKLKFEVQLEKAYSIFGNRAFKLNSNTTKINASLYEAIMIAFEDYSNDKLLDNSEAILKMHNILLNDDNFLSAITNATGNTENVNTRISKYIEALKGIMAHEC